MKISETHIFLKDNGSEELEVIKVYECRLPSPNLAATSKSLYFKNLISRLKMITKEEFKDLEKENLEILKTL
jgi:hypothetical protein